MQGQIRVGKSVKNNYGYIPPREKGFTTIRLHPTDKYASLCPYVLKDQRGYLVENLWQFSKIYERLNRSIQYKAFTKDVIWEWPAEKHIEYKTEIDQTILPEYLNWRHTGFKNNQAVRYPVGKRDSSKCVCALWNPKGLYYELDNDDYNFIELDYISARKAIYCGIYRELMKTHPDFIQLKDRLQKGENLLFSEVDCPGFQQTGYESILLTEKSCQNLILDTRYPFGHGIVIAAFLAGFENIICDSEIKVF